MVIIEAKVVIEGQEYEITVDDEDPEDAAKDMTEAIRAIERCCTPAPVPGPVVVEGELFCPKCGKQITDAFCYDGKDIYCIGCEPASQFTMQTPEGGEVGG
ncbi:MAG: hypothetical protein M0R06_14445 [Sphaerochaeta sp.]|jgi:hypothetical protein|nr:hypothetical protein [Sphaerochaeta sp.]